MSRLLIPFTRFTSRVFFVVCTLFFGEAKLAACGASMASCVACMTCAALCVCGGVASYLRV